MDEVAGTGRRRFVVSGLLVVGLVAVSWFAAPSTDLALAVAAVSAVAYAALAWRLLDQVHVERQRATALISVHQKSEAEQRERERIAEAHYEDGRQFQFLVDGVRDYAIVTLDPEGGIATWNAGAERIHGYDPEEIVGRHFSCFYLEEDQRQGKPESDLEIAKATGRFEEEGWRVRRDGSQFWANVIVSAVRDDAGELRGFFKITRDISERRDAADQIYRLNANLEQQIVQLAGANRELEQKNRENEMFVYSVSHDLRSPLVNLQGFSKELELVCQDLRQILVENELPDHVKSRGLTLIDEEIGESIQFIQSAVVRLSNIIDALLRLSRAGRVEYHPQQLDVQEIARRIVESLAGSIAEKDARVTVRDLPPAWGDPTAIEQVFANLLSNALKYLNPQRPGNIEVGYVPEATLMGQRLASGAYYVRDNGLGIADEYQDKVFQPFQRVHAGVASGEGMGLAIIRRVVERHGGQVWVESSSGEGSTFFVALPAPATLERENRRTEMFSPIDERNSENGRRTIGHCPGGR